MEYLLNEAQALVISMLARTPKAPEVRKMVIDVWPLPSAPRQAANTKA